MSQRIHFEYFSYEAIRMIDKSVTYLYTMVRHAEKILLHQGGDG